MKYAGIIYNDFAAAPGVSLSFFTQGCPHHCKGCHNPETWSFDGGHEFTAETLNNIIRGLQANGIKRSLAIMGGEPLCLENRFLIDMVIREVKKNIPDIEIYIWTGYYYDDLIKTSEAHLNYILEQTNVLIDGPYVENLRDITLPMRGSSNQNIINLKEKIDE